MGADYSPPTGDGGLVLGGTPARCSYLGPTSDVSVGGAEGNRGLSAEAPLQRHTCLFVSTLLWDEEWRTRFEKEIDLWFFLNPGMYWPHDMFEPLVVGISFPLSRSRPWLVSQLREEVVEAGCALSALSKKCHVQVGHYLRELWAHPRVLPPVPGGMVR